MCHFHVVADDDGEVLGRVNLVDVTDGAADLGFRVAEMATGRGLATAAVNQVCTRAARDYRRAAHTLTDTASGIAHLRNIAHTG